MSKITVERAKQSQGSLGGPLTKIADRDDVELVNWQIVPRAKYALVVIEYEEVTDGE